MKSKTILEVSREALYKACEKNIKTTMIGALDAIEKGFREELEGAEAQNKYLEVRQKILDVGNRQLRLLSQELDRYKIEKLRGFISLNITTKD